MHQRELKKIMIAITAGGASLLFCQQPVFASPTLEEKIELLHGQMVEQQRVMQQQIDELRSQLAEQKQQQIKVVKEGQNAAPKTANTSPEVTFGGQYRINSYNVDNDDGQGNQGASRVRIRQNIDIKFDEQFKTHLQVELGHTTDNITTTSGSTRGNTLAVRHAVLDYTLNDDINFQAGIVPLSDRFGDTLFSSDWDYNPVAIVATAPAGPGSLRFFAANLLETIGAGGESEEDDDTVHYQLDYSLPFLNLGKINFAAGYMELSPNSSAPFVNGDHYNYGVSGQFDLADNLHVNSFVLGSNTDENLVGSSSAASGVAAKIELLGKLWKGSWGLMATYASGDEEGSGFLPTMAMVHTNGYWGYMGILTVQGPTDTGFDGDSVNISNNGYGLTTAQAKYAFPVTDKLGGYLAVGWFGNTNAQGRDDTVGVEALAVGAYRFNKIMALDFGIAAASLEDSVSGYSQNTARGAAAPFNQIAGQSRDKTTFFSRLQAEF